MSKIFVVFLLITASINAFSQEERNYTIYEWGEVQQASPDTIFGLSFDKLKLDSLPSALENFKNLRYLNLDKNKLTALPDYISEWKNLEELSIEKNRFDHFPFPICQMKQLKIARLGKNYFEYIPDCIEGAVSLEYLDLYDTPIQKLPTTITKLKNLKKIDFTGIRFGPTFQDYWYSQLKDVELIFDPPCSCMEK